MVRGTQTTSKGGRGRSASWGDDAAAARRAPEAAGGRDRKWIAAGGVVGALFLLIGLAVRLAPAGDPADAPMDLSSPDALVATAFNLVEQGRVEALPRLIHADSEAIRSALDQIGLTLGEAQRLSALLRERFPEEAARLAEQSSSGLLGMIRGGGPEGRRGGRGARRFQDEGGPRRGPRGRGGGAGGDFATALLADPLGWLTAAEGRVSTIPNGDDMAAVLVDDRPAFGLGLALRKEGGRWGVVIPTAMPMATRFLPQNDDEWTILGAMAGSLRAGISDAHEDISRGSATDFDSAARLVGEKAGPPLFMCFVAYQRAIEARGSGG